MANNINPSFKEYVDSCVSKDGSLLTTEQDLFTIKNLDLTASFLKAIKPLFDAKNKAARKKNKEAGKNIEKIWSIGDIFCGNVFDDDSFKDIKDKAYNNYKEVIIQILLHCNWLMYLCSDRQHKQLTIEGYYKDYIDTYFNEKIAWAIGPTFSGTSLDAMLFIVELTIAVKENKGAVKEIENKCNDDAWKKGLKWNENDINSISSEAIVNILLYLCDSEIYLPIPAQNKKELIREKLRSLATPQTESLEGMSDIDKDLWTIRESLRKIRNQKYPDANPFWLHDIRPFWDESVENLSKDTLSDETLLEYKKAMVLYGPPGTSKSYQARRIAESVIAKALRQQDIKIKDCIEQLQDALNSHVHILQMHPNYTYDDFIVGKSIKGNSIEIQKGYLLTLLDSIKPDDTLPHVVILDEINRVDISRILGELFTAMEPGYREKGVELPVKDNKNEPIILKIPKNMYFIGTMNMIDFSLEQVDFALRRRFVWQLSTYDEGRLNEIISEKLKEKESSSNEQLWRDFPDSFINNCTALNNEIEWESNLGKNYLIGHAFFAEIVDICEKTQSWLDAIIILWNISILPTLEAYCGTMDSNSKDGFINKCKKAFGINTNQKE